MNQSPISSVEIAKQRNKTLKKIRKAKRSAIEYWPRENWQCHYNDVRPVDWKAHTHTRTRARITWLQWCWPHRRGWKLPTAVQLEGSETCHQRWSLHTYERFNTGRKIEFKCGCGSLTQSKWCPVSGCALTAHSRVAPLPTMKEPQLLPEKREGYRRVS